MKALTLIQPWASLVITGQKRIETRSYDTKFRGSLLIHAGKRQNEILASLITGWSKFLPDPVPFGALLGTLEVIDSIPADDARRYVKEGPHIIYGGFHEKELDFGDFTVGRFAWLLTNPRPFKEPIPYRGQQGFFDVPDDLLPHL